MNELLLPLVPAVAPMPELRVPLTPGPLLAAAGEPLVIEALLSM
jgi:hypothetical protein